MAFHPGLRSLEFLVQEHHPRRREFHRGEKKKIFLNDLLARLAVEK
jgi:hypothetical protein